MNREDKQKKNAFKIRTIIRNKELPITIRNDCDARKLFAIESEDSLGEHKLRPEYEKEIFGIEDGKFRKFSSIEEIRKGLKNA